MMRLEEDGKLWILLTDKGGLYCVLWHVVIHYVYVADVRIMINRIDCVDRGAV